MSRRQRATNRSTSQSKSIYTPKFYTPPSSLATTSRGVDNTFQPVPPTVYLSNLSKMHIAMAHIVTEVPPSPVASSAHLERFQDSSENLAIDGEQTRSTANPRVDTLRKRVEEAYEDANGDPADGRWAVVSRLLKMPVTRGRYKHLLARADGQPPPAPEKGWLHTSNEEHWVSWEARRVTEHTLRKKVEGWRGLVDVGDEEVEPKQQEVSVARTRETSRNKSNTFSAATPAKVGPNVSTSVQSKAAKGKEKSEALPTPASKAKTKAKTTNTQVEHPNPTPLGFAVVKKSSISIATKPKSKPPSPRPKPAQRLPLPSQPDPPPQQSPRSRPPTLKDAVEPEEHAGKTLASAIPKQISQLAEFSFLPPSFPDQLQTSTPFGKPDVLRRKPSPIPISPLESPGLPVSPPAFSASQRPPEPNVEEPGQAGQKRTWRGSTADQLPKRLRLTPGGEEGDEPRQVNLLTSTPSLSKKAIASLVTPKSIERLPTLNELLASKRKADEEKLKGKLRIKSPSKDPSGHDPREDDIPFLDHAKPNSTIDSAGPPIKSMHVPHQIASLQPVLAIRGYREEDDSLFAPPIPDAYNTYPDEVVDDPGVNLDLPLDSSPIAKSLSSLAEDDDDNPYSNNYLDDIEPLELTANGFDPPLASTQVQLQVARGKFGVPLDITQDGFDPQFVSTQLPGAVREDGLDITRDGFNPQFVSTQLLHPISAAGFPARVISEGDLEGGFAALQTQPAPARPIPTRDIGRSGSSGLWVPLFNSQVDVNRQIDEVNRFIEQDVDIDGWSGRAGDDDRGQEQLVDDIEDEDDLEDD